MVNAALQIGVGPNYIIGFALMDNVMSFIPSGPSWRTTPPTPL
jgi:hypothetical protein